MLCELRRAGFTPGWQCVETEVDYLAQLDTLPDIVLADCNLLQFNALRALQLLQERRLDIPCITVSRTMDEGMAVECMKRGAADYLRKDRLARLGAAVEHALEQRQLREAARQAQKMAAIGTLAGGMAHELNNILSAVRGYTELTLDLVTHGSRAWMNLQQVLAASQRSREVVQQLLTFSCQSEHERRLIHLHRIIREVLTLVRTALPSTITLQHKLVTTDDIVLADPTHIHQMLMHLCTNAEHAMRHTGGVLQVCLEALAVTPEAPSPPRELPPGPYLRLTVEDTGHGMTPEMLERIFEPFFTTKAASQGTGLGLAVVHGIVTSHGGVITAKSMRGHGTTFTVYLPRYAGSLVALDDPDTTTPTGDERILLVEDEEMLLRLEQARLERLGYNVVGYTNSLAALEAFRTAPEGFDLIVTNQTMPHMTGDVLAREVRGLRPDIPIVLCTGFSHAIDAERARVLGIDALCMKPVEMHDLSVVIRRVLAQHTALEG